VILKCLLHQNDAQYVVLKKETIFIIEIGLYLNLNFSALVNYILSSPLYVDKSNQPCLAALQKYYKFNNRPYSGRIASFFTAACSIAYFYLPALIQVFPTINKTLWFWALCTNWYVNAGKDRSDFHSCLNNFVNPISNDQKMSCEAEHEGDNKYWLKSSFSTLKVLSLMCRCNIVLSGHWLCHGLPGKINCLMFLVYRWRSSVLSTSKRDTALNWAQNSAAT
jgi:hypothetical protein